MIGRTKGYKGYYIQKDPQYDGVVILKDGNILATKATEYEAKRAIDKWTGNDVTISKGESL